ncbi:MAG: cobalamin-dependent protein [Planctomycetota bacterium]
MDSQGLFTARILDSGLRSLATGAVLRQHETIAGGAEFEDRVADQITRIQFLAEALAVGESEVLLAQVRWLRDSYAALGADVSESAEGLTALRDELLEELPPLAHARVAEYLDQARAAIEAKPHKVDSCELSAPTQALIAALIEARHNDAIDLVMDRVDAGSGVSEVELDLIVPAQREVGRMWQRGELDISQEHLSSRIVEEILILLHARIPTAPTGEHTVVVAPVRGNQHDIATRIVSHHFELAGWRALRVGVNIPVEELIRAVRDHRADVVGLSVTTGAHLRATAQSIRALRSVPEVADVPVLVGGPPFDALPELWKKVGADGYAGRIADGPKRAAELVRGRRKRSSAAGE